MILFKKMLNKQTYYFLSTQIYVLHHEISKDTT